MAQYAFTTHWQFQAPVSAVWKEIAEPLAWPRWWRGVERAEELQPGDRDGLHSVRRFTWKSRLPYRLTFDMRCTRVTEHLLIEGEASGEVEGFGAWGFAADGDTTRVEGDLATFQEREDAVGTERWRALEQKYLG